MSVTEAAMEWHDSATVRNALRLSEEREAEARERREEAASRLRAAFSAMVCDLRVAFHFSNFPVYTERGV